MDESIGMTYIEKVANGNAGEFYFAYWISSNFIWPCRILDIDMGVDAQIEIYDDLNHSTGMFIGAQVKTTAKTLEESSSISIPLKNIIYWASINDPIVIVRVCLNNNSREPSIYWKHLKKSELNDYLSSSKDKGTETVSINFEKDKNLLRSTDKSAWLRLFLSDADKKIIKNSTKIKEKLKFLGEHFLQGCVDGQIMVGYPHYQFALKLNDLLNEYDELNTAVKINPRLEYLSEEVKLAIQYYKSYIDIILQAFKEGWESHSIIYDDFDSHSSINLFLHRIMHGY